jgi:hypothetical protein
MLNNIVKCDPLGLLFLELIRVLFCAGLLWCPGQNNRIAPIPFFHRRRKRRLND